MGWNYACWCEKCHYHWFSRTNKLPDICPSCKTEYWNGVLIKCLHCEKIFKFPTIDATTSFCPSCTKTNWYDEHLTKLKPSEEQAR